MADVTETLREATERRPGDRGQLILVTGLAVAVILVALVLLLNTVIYAENLAARGADVGGQDAVGFRTDAVAGVERVVETENAADHLTADAARENVTEGVERYAELVERGYLERATVAELSNLTLAEGTALRHTNDSRAFTDESDATDWTLATDVGENEVRAFRFEVIRDELETSESSVFQVAADDGDDSWRTSVYRDGGDVVVSSDAGDCRVAAERATVDLTAGTLDGEPCSALAFAEGIDDPYALEYRNGDRASGRYSLVVNTSGSANVEGGNVAAPGADASPYYAHAVYSVTFDVHYRTARLTFAGELRVAPGESDD